LRTLIVLGLVGLVCQLIDGALGMAYGVTSTTLVLAAGYSPASASAAVHMAELGTTLASGIAHWRFGNVDWRVVRRLAIPGALGAFCGAVLLSNISSEVAKPWMGGVLLALGVFVLLRFALRGPREPKGRTYVRGRFMVPLGLGAGFVDATGGGGWGPVATPTLLASGKMEPRKVVGSVDTSEFLVALAASIGFLIALGSQGIPFGVVAALMVGGVVAAPVAAWLVRWLPARVLGTGVGGLIVMTNSRTVLQTLEASDAARWTAYLGIAAVWIAAVTWTVRLHRRALAAARAPEAEVAVETSPAPAPAWQSPTPAPAEG
jgi:uncharacterized membrane protein YfcA